MSLADTQRWLQIISLTFSIVTSLRVAFGGGAKTIKKIHLKHISNKSAITRGVIFSYRSIGGILKETKSASEKTNYTIDHQLAILVRIIFSFFCTN